MSNLIKLSPLYFGIIRISYQIQIIPQSCLSHKFHLELGASKRFFHTFQFGQKPLFGTLINYFPVCARFVLLFREFKNTDFKVERTLDFHLFCMSFFRVYHFRAISSLHLKLMLKVSKSFFISIGSGGTGPKRRMRSFVSYHDHAPQ